MRREKAPHRIYVIDDDAERKVRAPQNENPDWEKPVGIFY
jgi:hypothetical protein